MTFNFIARGSLFMIFRTRWKFSSKQNDTTAKVGEAEQLKIESVILRPCFKTAELERKKATRKMVLAGMFFLAVTEDQAVSTVVNGKTLADFLTQEEDRKLFGLE